MTAGEKGKIGNGGGRTEELDFFFIQGVNWFENWLSIYDFALKWENNSAHESAQRFNTRWLVRVLLQFGITMTVYFRGLIWLKPTNTRERGFSNNSTHVIVSLASAGVQNWKRVYCTSKLNSWKVMENSRIMVIGIKCVT